MITQFLKISGLVQGVGFRPYVYHLALSYNLTGWVRNFSAGIEVIIQGESEKCKAFLNALPREAPPVSEIEEIQTRELSEPFFHTFEILKSRNGHDFSAGIAPDLAICDLCLHDIQTRPRRYHHLFTSCTHCGPRFSIIKGIPYDRQNTTMNDFGMCPDCRDEYRDIYDRRFHAQPIACLKCGPSYKWYEKEIIETKQDKIPGMLASAMREGKIVAVKDTGGYHLLCNAESDYAVKRLRKIKKRDGKPFAVLFKDIYSIRKYAFLNAFEEKLLLSARRPVVILRSKRLLSGWINHGLNSIGVILPYTPLHHLLMTETRLNALVFTSANFSGEPLISDDRRALSELLPVCDAVLTNNRKISYKQDDSVVRSVNNMAFLIRRSRGYAPGPVLMSEKTEGIVAMGADMKNCFCIGKGDKAILSQHIGDLENYDVNLHYRKSLNDFLDLFQVRPGLLVCDPHPAYHSSRYAKKLYTELYPNAELMEVQHHHAHIASVMAEYGLDEKVIGVSMDGSGYGEDGNIWGSEFLIADLTGYERKYHMEYLKLPGAELAIREPWRIALACLYDIFGVDYGKYVTALDAIQETLRSAVIKSLEKDLLVTRSCGMGRLFDVVAVLLNLCHHSRYDGEGPALLEGIINPGSASVYEFTFREDEILVELIIEGILKDKENKVPLPEIAARFHNTVAEIISKGVSRIAKETGLEKVALSGGTFQNMYLTGRVCSELKNKGFQVYMNQKVPCNDGGLALGQMAVAMKKRSLNI